MGDEALTSPPSGISSNSIQLSGVGNQEKMIVEITSTTSMHTSMET
jgi:hypothetical protein